MYNSSRAGKALCYSLIARFSYGRASEWKALSLFLLRLSLRKFGIVAKLAKRALPVSLEKLLEERLSSASVLKNESEVGRELKSFAAKSRL